MSATLELPGTEAEELLNHKCMTIDKSDHLWVAFWAGSAIRGYDLEGNMVEEVRMPVSRVTSCAFGGEDLGTLYVTTARVGLDPEGLLREPLAGGVFKFRPDEGGLPPVHYSD